jgi:hypothetical protein
MQRRKFVVGLGSLAAGGAATMGTGAFSQATISDRQVSIDIENDADALVGLDGDKDSLANPEYSEQGDDGELKIYVNENADLPENPDGFSDGGNGVNPDSEYYFDGIFAIENNGPGEDFGDNVQSFEVSAEDNLNNPKRVRFYWQVGNKGGRDTDLCEDPMPISPGTFGSIGLYVDAPEQNETDWENGSLTIIAERATSNDNSDSSN